MKIITRNLGFPRIGLRRERKKTLESYWAANLTSTELLDAGRQTSPITTLQWSFVCDDQPRSETAAQLALAIRNEVRDMEAAGIGVIQIDVPAMRE